MVSFPSEHEFAPTHSGLWDCTDQAIFRAVPFYFYWVILFGLWAVVLGVPLSIVARARKQRLPVDPMRYALAAFAFILVGAPLTMGAVATPVIILIIIWIYRLGKAALLFPPQPPHESRLLQWVGRYQRILFFVCVGVIPMGYLRFWLQTHRYIGN